MTLTRRLLLLALISVLPAIVIWTIHGGFPSARPGSGGHDLALRQAQLAASELERIFDGIRSLLVAVAEMPAIRWLDTPPAAHIWRRFRTRFRYILSITAIDLGRPYPVPAGHPRHHSTIR